MGVKNMDVLGVRVDNLERKEILGKISNFLSEDKFHQIATINPEIVLQTKRDENFKNILNSCNLNIADGFGIACAFWWLKNKLKFRMTGIDLMQEILKMANEKKLRIFLAAKSGGLSSFEETREAILNKYQNLKIGGANINVDSQWPIIFEEIVFCNFGAPFQEIFLNGLKCDKIKLAVGVGGSFDYLTGRLKRAPKWMQFFGVEWLWRLMLQPKRIGRILNAVIVFPIKIIFNLK
jgi:N-acetylglucosaminyldiphosphoundecaprenol N-acetyl-beta-D-mannosaminyltransferase